MAAGLLETRSLQQLDRSWNAAVIVIDLQVVNVPLLAVKPISKKLNAFHTDRKS